MSELIGAPTLPEALALSDGSPAAAASGVSITWANKGFANDRFTEVFGATNAPSARAVVQQVLDDWGRAITSFGRADGTNTLTVNVSMSSSGTGFGAVGAPASSNQPADGMPRTGSMTLGRGNDTNGDNLGDGGGWYIDPNPADSAEFDGTVTNAFAAYRSSGSSFDLYTAVSLELTHVLGLISGTGWTYKWATTPYLSTTNLPDTAEAGSGNTGTLGYYAAFRGPTIKHLMTTNNGGTGGTNWGTPIHTAGPTSGNVTLGTDVFVGGDDSGNAVYDSARYLPNEVVLRLLADAYGYSIADPKTLPTFYAQLNSSGVLTVRGRTGTFNSADTIDISQVGTKLRVSVDIGVDTPGSGALAGAGDLGAYVAEFEMASINSVVVYGGDGNDIIAVDGIEHITVNGGAGGDTLRIRKSNSGINVTMRGDEDNDQVQLGENRFGLANTMDGLKGNPVVIEGGSGTNDYVHFEDGGNNLITPYTVGGFTFRRVGVALATMDASSEYNRIYNGPAGSTFYVESTRIPTTIYGGEGSDVFYVGDASNTLNNILAPVEVRGEGGTADMVEFRDWGYANPGDYTLAGNTLIRTGTNATALMTFNSADSFWLRTGGATDEIHIVSTGNDYTYKVSSGANSDRFYLGDGASIDRLDPLDGPLFLDAEGGSSDELRFIDDDEDFARTYTLNDNTLSVNGMATVSTLNFEEIYVYGSRFGDTFNVIPSTTVEYFLEGNGGTDTLNVTTSGTTSPFQNVTSASTGVWTFGNRKQVEYVEIENNGGSVNQPPTLSSFAASPSSVTVGNTTVLTSTASDSDGSVTSVKYYRETNGTAGLQIGGDTLLLSVSTGPTWQATLGTTGWTIGTNTLYAHATDDDGATSTVSSAVVNVSAANGSPSIGSFGVAPDGGTAGTSVNFIAGGVSDPVGFINSVVFYRESNFTPGLQPGSDTYIGVGFNQATYLYSLVFNTAGLSVGTHTFHVIATDNTTGSATASTTLTIVAPPNIAPVIGSVTASATTLAVNTPFTLTANNVSDSDGIIAKVSFYLETNGTPGLQVGSDTLYTADTNGNDGYFLQLGGFATAGVKTLYVQATDNAGGTSATSTVSVTVTATTPPTCYYGLPYLEMLPLAFLCMFDQNVGASLDVNDLKIVNRVTGVRYPLSSVEWDADNKGATFRMNSLLPNGYYTMTLQAAGVSAGGIGLAGDYSTSFHVMAADGNGDRKVNFNDLLILAANFNKAGRTFSSGNYDRSADGLCNFNDLLLLASRFNTELPPLPSGTPAAASSLVDGTPTTTRKRQSLAADTVG